jgi:REP element-mobilizing transposase RayT
MSRPPRTQFHGARYHVTSRGNRRAPIFLDRRDHLIWLDILAATVAKHSIRVHGYCLMPNHFHLLIATPHANLSDAMHMQNACYCQHFNKRHGTSGHVIQGRFHAVLVESDRQLLAVARYISLNPVRAKLASGASDWPWSHHRHFLSPSTAPKWLDANWLLSQFGSGDSPERAAKYEAFVQDGIGKPNPLQFHRQVPDPKREHALSLEDYLERYPERDQAMAQALLSTAFTRQEIAEFFGVSTKTVSRALARYPEADGSARVHQSA